MKYISITIIIVLFFSFFYFAGKIRAQSDTDIFGGTITQVIYCTCYYDPGEVLQVQPPGGGGGGASAYNTSNGNQLLSFFGFVKEALAQSSIDQEKNLFYSYYYSKDYDAYNIYDAEQQGTLGGYEQGGQCLDTSNYTCQQNSQATQIDGTVDMIRGIGTSAQPANSGGGQ